jgi:hypothetical protein
MESKHFAWLPITVTSGERIWLSTYYLHKSRFDVNTGRPPICSLYFTWTETAEERLMRLLKGDMIQNRNVWNDPLLTKEDKI